MLRDAKEVMLNILFKPYDCLQNHIHNIRMSVVLLQNYKSSYLPQKKVFYLSTHHSNKPIAPCNLEH